MTKPRSQSFQVSSLGLLAAIAVSSLASADTTPPFSGDRLSVARSELEGARTRSEEIGNRLAQREGERSALKARLTSDGRALYRLNRSGLLPLTSGLEGLLSHASRMERMERIVRSDLTRLTDLEQELGRLRGEQDALGRQVEERSREVSGLERAQAAQIQRQIEQNLLGGATLARSEPASTGGHMNYGLSVIGSKDAAHRRFVEQRGALALPVSGPSSIQEATRAESGGPGLEFSAQRGAAVRAAAEGRVAFSDRYGSYGQLVIVDHGDRYYTVYGGFAAVEVQVGDEVSKSARLGTSGSGAIYFEVRRGTKTEDARPWLGL